MKTIFSEEKKGGGRRKSVTFPSPMERKTVVLKEGREEKGISKEGGMKGEGTYPLLTCE